MQAGARVAATCSARNRETVESLGAAASIDYRAQDIAAALRAWAPGGVDLVLDAVGGDTLPDALDLLAPGGTLANIMTLAAGDAERLAATAAVAARRGLRTAMTYSRMPSGGTLGRIAAQLDKRALRVPRFDRFRSNRRPVRSISFKRARRNEAGASCCGYRPLSGPHAQHRRQR